MVDHKVQGRQAAGARKPAGRGLKLREATFEDYGRITELGSRFGFRPKSYEHWSHLWLGNPLYPAVQSHWSVGWVLEDDRQRIVGSLENIPLSYEFEGRSILVAASRGWVVEPGYRSASLMLFDRVINQPHVDLFVSNTVNAASAPTVSTYCVPVPVGVWNESAFWITHHQSLSESFLRRRGYPLAKPLSYPLAAVVYLKGLFSSKPSAAGGVEVTTCQTFDERFDAFWIELRAANPHLLLAVRSREVLAWHYRYALLNDRLWIGTIVDGLRLVAFAIFDRVDSPEIGLKQMRLVDFQSLDGGTALLWPLLSWALKRCRDEGVHMLENVGRWLEPGDLIGAIAPHRRRLRSWLYFYRATDPGLAERLRDRRSWAPTLFDGDASLLT